MEKSCLELYRKILLENERLCDRVIAHFISLFPRTIHCMNVKCHIKTETERKSKQTGIEGNIFHYFKCGKIINAYKYFFFFICHVVL